MTREARLIVTLVVMSGLGVAGLMLVANQYRNSLPSSGVERAKGDEALIRTVRLVDGYLAARSAVKAVMAGDFSEVAGQKMSGNADGSSTYRIERRNAFTAHGMTYEDYAAVRAAWRNYRSGVAVNDAALVAAFRARRAQLENANLGPIEALDDAIK